MHIIYIYIAWKAAARSPCRAIDINIIIIIIVEYHYDYHHRVLCLL